MKAWCCIFATFLSRETLPVIIKDTLEIKCKFQKTEFFEDQFEEIGQLNYNQAIEFYSTFQFSEELNKYYNRELTSCFPKIVFYSENEKSLTIWAENNEGIFFRYENNFQFFESYVSFDINQNKLELNIIEIIRIFYNNEIESIFNLKKKVIEHSIDTQIDNLLIFDGQKIKPLKKLLKTIPFLILWIGFVFYDIYNEYVFGIYFYLISSLVWLTSIIIYISYFFNSKNVKVTIDAKNKILVYEKNKNKITVKREDIHNCEINIPNNKAFTLSDYSYVWFVLKDGKRFVINNFVAEPYDIINNFKPNYKATKVGFPFLPL